MTRDATLHDVADRVGVSARTVSRVVNDEGGFSEATRQKVLAAVEELGYRPNMLARGLITRRSGTVGLVGGDMTAPFFPAVAEGVQRTAREAGFTMFFASTGSDPTRQAEVLDSLWSHGVDGVIVFPALDSAAQVADYARRGLSMVIVDDEIDGPNLGCISFDLRAGAQLATRHLLERGRQRLAMLGSTESPSRRRRRELGFLDVMSEAGSSRGSGADTERSADPPIIRAAPTIDGGRAAIRELLASHPDRDGVVAYNDLMAIGAIQELTAGGRRVPDDVGVVGFDDIDMAAIVTPSLTTVRLDRDRLSEEAVRAVRELRDHPGQRLDPVTLPVELTVRQSS